MRLLILAIAVLILTACGPSGPRELSGVHRDAVQRELATKHLTQPNELELQSSGFVVATYVVERFTQPPRAFGEERLLAIREALLRFGFMNYRVNVNGPPPGTGLVRRYGASRLIGGDSVEWLVP